MLRLRLVAVFAASFVLVGCSLGAEGRAKNIILLIGDGMGQEQLKAASMYAHGTAGKLEMQKLPRQAEMTTFPIQGPLKVTDSAAAGSALATGQKHWNSTLSVDYDNNLKPHPTILEQCQEIGKRTGLVSTMYISHATPAAFAAHCRDRSLYDIIAYQIITKAKPNVLFGGVYPETKVNLPKAEKAGYTVVSDREGMEALDKEQTHVLGQFGPGHLPYEHSYLTGATKKYDTLPHLSEMAVKALELLEDSDKGFFLMIEGGHIDSAGHDNNLAANVHETLEFDRTVAKVLEWAKDREDTLIIVTADHETGGLRVTRNNGKGKLPGVAWDSNGHTNAKVNVFATGPGSDAVKGVLDNTDIYQIMAKAAGVKNPNKPAKMEWRSAEFSAAREAARLANEVVTKPATAAEPSN
jgi:alkaline phosphatase